MYNTLIQVSSAQTTLYSQRLHAYGRSASANIVRVTLIFKPLKAESCRGGGGGQTWTRVHATCSLKLRGRV